MARIRPAAERALRGLPSVYRAERAARPFTGTLVIGWIYLVGWALWGATSVAQALIPSSDVTLAVPVLPYWPALPSGSSLDTGDVRFIDGGFSSADVTVHGLSVVPRLWLAIGWLLIAATNIAVSLLVRRLVLRVRAGSPFTASLRRAVVACAWLVLGAGIAWQICLGVGSTLAANELLGTAGGAFPATIPFDPFTIVGVARPGVDVTVDFWPIGVGLALLVLARLLRIGERMQHRSAELERETAGLV